MSGFLPGTAIDRDVSSDVLNTLAQKMCEQSGPNFTSRAERIRRAGSSDPDRQFRLNRTGAKSYVNLVACASSNTMSSALPESPHNLDISIHDLVTGLVTVRCEHKVVGMPAGSKRDSDSSL